MNKRRKGHKNEKITTKTQWKNIKHGKNDETTRVHEQLNCKAIEPMQIEDNKIHMNKRRKGHKNEKITTKNTMEKHKTWEK